MKHAQFGSSTAERVINCPGSVLLNAQSPESPPGDAALRGSAQHALIEHLLLEGGEAADFVGAKFADYEIEKEMADDVAIALKAAEELLEQYNGEQFIEKTLVIVPHEVFGTGDVVALSSDGAKALIADHKFGGMQVDADSPQLLFLAAAALVDPDTAGMFADVEEFKLAIIQPAFDPPVVERVVTRDEAVVFLRTIRLAHTASQAKSAATKMGKWCKWCRAKPICPAQREMFSDLIDQKLHPSWTMAMLADFLDKVKAAEDLIDTVKERAKHELSNGHKIPGWVLKPGASRVTWASPAKDTIAALRGLGLKANDIVQPITPAAAKKLLNTELPDDLVVRSNNAPSLARASETKETALPVEAFKKAAALSKR
jgi:hypothetical protein